MKIGDITITGLTIPVKLTYKRNQLRGSASSGLVKVFSGLSEDVFLTITIKKENQAVAGNLKDYIRTIINYSANPILITPDAGDDYGDGKGVACEVRYWSDNFIITTENGGLIDFEFTFRKENSAL